MDCKGRITAGGETAEFRGTFEDLIASGKANLILNLADVDFIDSTGLGALVVASGTAKKKGGRIKLLNLNKRNVELLVITKLTTIFEIFDDEQDAVNSFFPDRQVRTFDLLAFVRDMKQE
ncbi:MAG: anti-sigma-factor antagonist [Bryobacterales bacterium]|nr:anti-sigma-factor antagonist [Bryobacterales bacterium]